MKLKNEYLYCVAQKSGHLCLWSVATNPADSWRAFRRGMRRFDRRTVEEARRVAKAEGNSCVRLRVAVADEREN